MLERCITSSALEVDAPYERDTLAQAAGVWLNFPK